MGKYNEGDLVRLVKGDTVLQGRVADVKGDTVLQGRVADVKGDGHDRHMVLPLAHEPNKLEKAIFLEWYEQNGFEIEVIEKAEPKLELPTEHGIYVPTFDKHSERIYVLNNNGWMFYANGHGIRRTEREMIDGIANADGTALEKLVRLVREDEK